MMPELLHQFLQNLKSIFSGRNLLYHALAIILTLLIVISSLDWHYYLWTRGDAILLIARPGIMLGSLLPILGTLAILTFGEIRKNQRMITTAWALGQASFLGFLISISYKAFTGRIPPPHFRGLRMPDALLTDTSHGFQLGFLKGGVFWGWPSSHTTVAFAFSICLITLYPKKKLLVVLALVYASYVGLSVSVSIHCLSEFVAGAIVGSVIGSVVGRSFRERLG